MAFDWHGPTGSSNLALGMKASNWLLAAALVAAGGFCGVAADAPPFPAQSSSPAADVSQPGALIPQIFPEPAPVVRPVVRPVRPNVPFGEVPVSVIAWDSVSKEAPLKPGELEARFVFILTNVCDTNVTIFGAHASCGCTVAQLPATPWRLTPGSNGTLNVSMNVAGKSGVVIKTVTVSSDAGTKLLTVRAIVPPPQAAGMPASLAMSALDRQRNQELSKADRMAVFKGDCARCHLEPARGKMGKELFTSACGVCHLAEHRASMVPDLTKVNSEGGAEYWRNWITKGKAGSLMPAWAQSEGGPLTPDQIESVVRYLTTDFVVQKAVAVPPVSPPAAAQDAPPPLPPVPTSR